MYVGLSLPSSMAYDTASSGSMIAPRVSESSTPKRWSALPGPCADSTFRFLDRISARAIRQSFSALVWAIDCSERACWEAIWDCRYCQIEVATRPATPMTKLERKLWYVWMNFPSFDSFPVDPGSSDDSPASPSSALTRGIYCSFPRREHALARTARGEVGHPPPAAGDHRARGLVVFPQHLARARRRGADAAARSGGAPRDRLPADGGADDGGPDPDHAGVLRAGRLLRAGDPPLDRPPGTRAPRRPLQPGRLRRALPAHVVGAHPHRRLSGPAPLLAVLLPARPPGRLRPARGRNSVARLDLRNVRGGDGAGAVPGERPARLRQLLPDVQAGRTVVARLLHLGAAVRRPVLHAGDLLPRLLAAGDAHLRRRRDLVDGGPLLHDPFRQAVPRGLRRDGGRRRPRIAGDAHPEHLRRLPGARHGGDLDGRAGALPASRAPHGADADGDTPPEVSLLVEPALDRLDPGGRSARVQSLASNPRPTRFRVSPGFVNHPLMDSAG